MAGLEIIKIYVSRCFFLLMFFSCNKYSSDNENNIIYYMYISDLELTKELYVCSNEYTYKSKNISKDGNVNNLELKKLDKIFKFHKNKIYDFDRDSGTYFKIIRDSSFFKDSVYIKRFHVTDGYYNDLKNIDSNLLDMFIFMDTIK